jgi:hypothetical protein
MERLVVFSDNNEPLGRHHVHSTPLTPKNFRLRILNSASHYCGNDRGN